MERTIIVPSNLELGDNAKTIETMAMSLAATHGTITDTTTYPVTKQAGKTEKVTVAGGAEQTVLFTAAITQGRQVCSSSFPVADQDTKTVEVKVKNGATQTVTFSGATTTPAHVVAQMDPQLAGCKVVVLGGVPVIICDDLGSDSTIEVTGGTSDLTWAAAVQVNTPEGIASELASQLSGVAVGVEGGQVVMTADVTGPTSTIDIGTGTTDLTWGAPVDGTGQSGTVAAGTLLARDSVTKKLVPYEDAGINGANEPIGVMPEEVIWTSAGDKKVYMIRSGKVAKNRLSKHDDVTAIDTLVFDKLMANSSIVVQDAVDVSVYGN